MITLQSLFVYLEELFSPYSAPDPSWNGLQIEGKEEIRKIGVAVSANLKAIEKGIDLGIDTLIVHHGLFWKGATPLIQGPLKEKLSLLLKHNISLIAYHIPLDAHPTLGNNWKAAHEMGWENLNPFGGYKGIDIGVRGKIPPTPIKSYIKELEEFYNHPAHAALGGKDKIEKIALISGGAHREITQAIEEEVDLFITGSFDEPIWDIAFENKIHFAALGHHATEKIGVTALGKHLSTQFSLPMEFIDIFNPF